MQVKLIEIKQENKRKKTTMNNTNISEMFLGSNL